MVWSLADRVRNLIEKKRPSLSDSDIVTGGLIVVMASIEKIWYRYYRYFCCKVSIFFSCSYVGCDSDLEGVDNFFTRRKI